MIPIANIATAVNNAKLYLIEETKALKSSLEISSKDCVVEKYAHISKLVKAISYDVARNYVDSCTELLYKQLVVKLDGFNETYTIDESVEFPSNIIAFYVGPNAQWGMITGNIDNQTDLINKLKAPSWKNYGPWNFGKYGPGETIPAKNSVYEQILDAYSVIPHPNYIQPECLLSSNQPTNLRRVGATLSIDFLLAFQQNDAGEETGRQILKNGVPIVGTTDNIVLSISQVVYVGNVSHNQGPVKNNEEGNPDPIGRIPAGTSISNELKYKGTYPIFATTVAINLATEQNLVDSQTANNVIVNLVAETGGDKQFIDLSEAWLNDRPLLDIKYFDALTGGFTIVGKLNDFAVTNINHIVEGSVLNFKRFTNTSPNRGPLPIQLVF